MATAVQTLHEHFGPGFNSRHLHHVKARKASFYVPRGREAALRGFFGVFTRQANSIDQHQKRFIVTY